MAEIPTYTARLSPARGVNGQVQAELDNSAVRAAAAQGQVGEAISHAGSTLATISASVAQVQNQRAKEQELKWVGDASQKLNDTLIQWQQDHQHDEDYGIAYRKFADEQVKTYTDAAPNARASDAFRLHIMPSIQRDWETALKIGERTRLNNFGAAEVVHSESESNAFRFRMANGEPEAARDIMSYSLKTQHERIDAAYGKISPPLAAKMKETATADAVLGVLETDPVFAKELLDSARNVDGQTRSVLVNKIEAASNQIDEVAAQRMARALDSQLKNAKDAGTLVAVPPKESFGVFKKHADAQYESFVQEAKVHNETVGEWDKLKSLSPFYQAQAIEELRASINPNRGEIAHGLRQNLIGVHNDLARGNVAGHIAKNYEDVAGLFRAADLVKDPAERVKKIEQANSKSLYYQGAAPRDDSGKLLVSDADAKKFLNLSTGQQHTLSADQANERGAKLNGMGPQDMWSNLMGMTKEFGNEKIAAIAFNDLATLPQEGNRLPAAAQLAVNMPPELAIKFLGVVKASKDIKPLPDVTAKEFRDYLYTKTDGVWTAFRRTFNGDNNQRAALLDDFESSILKYAHSLNGEGISPKEAVQKAVKDTISGSFGFGNVNGTPMMVMRNRGEGKPQRTEAEAADIPRKLVVSLREFPLASLDLKDPTGRTIWPQLDSILNKDAKDKYVMDAITSRGFFVTESHGQSATIYVADESGKATSQQLRDKRGQPFEIAFDDLPAYTRFQGGALGRGTFGFGGTVELPIQPSKTYERVEKIPYQIWYDPQYRTNWPSPGLQYSRQVKPLGPPAPK